MRELSDKQLDNCIAHALNEGHISPQQRQRAWEQLQRRAAAQDMLPPLPAQPARRSMLRRLEPLLELGLRQVKVFFLDEAVYSRARHHYFWLEFYDSYSHSFTMQQRFAYAVFRS
jgi:hypothetical protein